MPGRWQPIGVVPYHVVEGREFVRQVQRGQGGNMTGAQRRVKACRSEDR